MPRNPTPEDHRRDDLLFILWLVAFHKRILSCEREWIYEISFEYMRLLHEKGVDVDDFPIFGLSMRRQYVNEALFQATHYRIIRPVGDRYELTVGEPTRHKMLTSSGTLTLYELRIARETAAEAVQSVAAASK